MAQSTTIANQEQPPTTTQQQLASQQQPLPKIQISQKPPHRSPQKKKNNNFLVFPFSFLSTKQRKRAEKTKNDRPNREENTSGWNYGDPYDSRPPIGHETLLIFPTMKSYFGGHKTNQQANPKRMSLIVAKGKQTTNFNHSYNPSIRPVLFKNGSTMDDPHSSKPLDPRNSYWFSLLLTIILLPLPLLLLWWEFWWMWFIELSLLLPLLLLWERESWMVRIRWGGSEGWEGRRGEERSGSAIVEEFQRNKESEYRGRRQ